MLTLSTSVEGANSLLLRFISPHTNPFCIVHQAQLYILMDQMEPLILGLPIVQNRYFLSAKKGKARTVLAAWDSGKS